MLRLNELELIQLFRQPGGAEFVRFCNEVIRATCWEYGVAQSEVSTTTRTDAKDGGVDTRLARGIPSDRSGYFSDATVWQFKAANETNVTDADMRVEVNKPHARARIENGHAYRICICDHVTDQKRESLEGALRLAIKGINATAPVPRVLSIDDIAKVANSYPALVMQYRPGMNSVCILFDRWGENITAVTPKFIPAVTFEATKAMILAHADFGKPAEDAVISLHGLSGVGKTRTVYESIREQEGANTIVVYLDDEENADGLANMLLNDELSHAVIVADDCSLETRVRLSRKLTSCRNRVRCICIDNSTDRPGTALPELAVRKPSSGDLQSILHANFPQIPRDRLQTYAELSEGFVRIAADMCCHYDHKIAEVGNIGPIVSKLEDYYRERLGSEERMKAVEAISLLKRVRHKGAPNELDQVCELTKMDRAMVEQNLAAIKDAPGFVERGELYYRVTPELIAMIAFDAAWKRWAEGKEDGFLASIPEAIQETFLQRVSEGREEVRKTVQAFFRRFATSFTPKQLAENLLVKKLISLIETDPEQYLPLLRQLVNSATHVDLTSSRDTTSGWGPRRQLVWLAERFAQFKEFFATCEDILFVLATHECEQNISNNATQIWQQLFRMQLSGTSVPLLSRLEVLNERLQRATESDAVLVAGAIGEILNFRGMRMLGPPVVAGRIVPAEWYPAPEEARELILVALRFLEKASRHPISTLATQAKLALLDEIEFLARQGWIDELRLIVKEANLDEDARARLVSRLKNFVKWANRPDSGTQINEEYARKVDAWIAELEPRSLHGRLVEVLGARSWDHFGRESEWQSSLKKLATELTEQTDVFDQELDWLVSPEAQSAYEFGYEVGSIDLAAALLDKILEHSIDREIGFARGYVAGQLYGAEGSPRIVEERLDAWEKEDPLFSFQLALAGGERVRVFDRAVRLIRTNKLPAYQLRNFTHWVGRSRPTNEQVLIAMDILLSRVRADEEFCSDALMDFLGARLHSREMHSLLAANNELVWTALIEIANHPGRQTFWWGETLQAIVSDNPRLAIHLACKALGQNFDLRDVGSRLLTQWASTYPSEIMSELGRMMLDTTTGVRFFLSKFPVFASLPTRVIINWLKEAGSEGAQKIARHLPPPSLSDGQPMVPELTAWVLTEFENDDRVFSEFYAGVHSFQMYTGDVAAIHESEAEMARKFFSHPIRRIREWAHLEYESALHNAQRQREWEDERR